MLIVNTLGILPLTLFILLILFHKKLRERVHLVYGLFTLMPLLAIFKLGGLAGLTILQATSIVMPIDYATGLFAVITFYHLYTNSIFTPYPLFVRSPPIEETPEEEVPEAINFHHPKMVAQIKEKYRLEAIAEKEEKAKKQEQTLALRRSRENEKKPVTPKIIPRISLPSITIIERKEVINQEVDNDFHTNQGSSLTKAYDTFGIKASLVDFITGPTVTTYRIQPEVGTRYNKMINLQREIMGALKATSIRTVAPIAGTSYVGIEVPNKKPTPVHFRTMLEEFPTNATSTTVALGKSNSGDYIFCDLAKMPHLLVAGTTGSGKSVALQGMVTSLLMRNTPETLQLALIDPKQAEFSAYENLPHLFAPVVYTDTKKARGLIRSLVDEMEKRNELFRRAGVKSLKDYNKGPRSLPYIVLFIEEYADLGMADAESSKSDGPTISSSLCRIAQKARSAGIITVLATQRPSADALPPLVRSNFPSAIACNVRGEADSKIILGEIGAESLLGNGDMLYKPAGANSPERLQGVFVTDKDIASIVRFYKS